MDGTLEPPVEQSRWACTRDARGVTDSKRGNAQRKGGNSNLEGQLRNGATGGPSTQPGLRKPQGTVVFFRLVGILTLHAHRERFGVCLGTERNAGKTSLEQ